MPYFACLGAAFLLFACAPLHAHDRLEEFARLDAAPGNITVTPQGRIIVSLHQFYEPAWRVVELRRDGTLVPFPDEAWAGGAHGRITLDTVLGIQSDRRGVVWMLDNGMRGGITPKLIAWDTRRHRLSRVIHLPPPVTAANSFVNDLAVDETHNALYIADPAGGTNAALIVVDIATGYARRVLEGHRSVVPEDIDLTIDGRPVQIRRPDGSLLRPRVGINPIALDARHEYLYFGPMHGTSLYRIAVRDLLDPELDAAVLAERVERYSDKPICDGISIDRAGNIYISDIGNNAVGVIDKERRYRLLVQDPRLSWPDAFSFGPDGRLYVVANQLHRTARLNAGEHLAAPPFYVLRLRPLAQGVVGR